METKDRAQLVQLRQLEFPVQSIHYVGYAEHPPGWSADRDSDYDVMYFVRSGQMSVTVEGVTVRCGTNSLFCRGRSEKVQIRNASSTEAFALYSVLFRFREDVTFQSLELPRQVQDRTGTVLPLVRQLHVTFLEQGAAYSVKIFSEFAGLLQLILRGSANTETGIPADKKIRASMQFIRQYYDRPLTVEELSRTAGYSPSHFRRVFSQCCGMSPQTFILHTRLEGAKRLLLEDSKSVGEIAQMLHFCNASYFCRLFREKTGLTPHQFRQQARYSDIEAMLEP